MRIMKVKTIIAIPAHGSGQVGNPQPYKKAPISLDRDRLQKLSDQLTSLVEELDDIREDLSEMYSELEDSCFAEEGYDSDEELVDRMEEICGTVSGAYEELNEALGQMAELY